MFNFFRKSQPAHPSAALCEALVSQGFPSGLDPLSLRVVQRRGSYAGRSVRFFRVFDPVGTTERELVVRSYADLDSHPDLVLASGHFESDGAIVLSRRDRTPVKSRQ